MGGLVLQKKASVKEMNSILVANVAKLSVDWYSQKFIQNPSIAVHPLSYIPQLLVYIILQLSNYDPSIRFISLGRYHMANQASTWRGLQSEVARDGRRDGQKGQGASGLFQSVQCLQSQSGLG